MFGFVEKRQCINLALSYIQEEVGEQQDFREFVAHIVPVQDTDFIPDEDRFDGDRESPHASYFFWRISRELGWSAQEQADVLEHYLRSIGPEFFIQKLQLGIGQKREKKIGLPDEVLEAVQKGKVSRGLLRRNPHCVFVFGDNNKRKGYGGAAMLRDEPNAYGFVTKKEPTNNSGAFYSPKEYMPVFDRELAKLRREIEKHPGRIFLISKLGGGLANKHRIHQRVIAPGLKDLDNYANVFFLY